MDDARLEEILVSIGHDLDVASPPARVPRGAHRGLVAAAVVVVVVALTVAVAPTRRAVTGWLHIGGTDFEVDVDVPARIEQLPSFVDGAVPISPSEAATRLGHPLPDLAATALGAPTAWFAPFEGGVVAVWDDGATSLWLLPLTEGADQIFVKTVATADQVTVVDGLGERAVVVEGEHGMETPRRLVRAGAAVLWIDDEISYRLEADRPADELVGLARDVAGS